MQVAEYPQRMCKQAVWGKNDAAYHCELPDLHPGPCASQSSKVSVEARDRWEAAHPDWQNNIGDMTNWT